jgi:ABC-type sugar transport system permease subunit
MPNAGYSVTKIQRYGYLFILPTLVFFSVFLIYPIVSAFVLSFYQWSLLGPKVYVGFKNFATMITDQRVINSFVLTLHFSVISVVAINILAFILAIMFSSNLIRFKNLLQSLVFLPVVLSIIAVGVVWEFMFQSTGLINILSRFLFGVTIPWLVDTRTAPYALIMVYVWKTVGYYMVIYIAGLLDVPASLYESARIDGAGFWGQLFYITIPSLKNTITLAIVSCMIFTFGQFSLQYVITKGGPSRSTEILALLIFQQGFGFGKFGYSAVISVLFFVSLLIFSTIQLRLFKSESSQV